MHSLINPAIKAIKPQKHLKQQNIPQKHISHLNIRTVTLYLIDNEINQLQSMLIQEHNQLTQATKGKSNILKIDKGIL